MASRPDPDVHGFVLCGGASRRMGRDKATIDLDGRALVARIADALHLAGCAPVATVGGDRASLARACACCTAPVGHHPDDHPGEGPLGGILTALSGIAGSDVAVIVSCDLLSPDAAAIRAVSAARDAADADVAVPVVGGREQWLHSAWHARSRRILADVFAAGERSVAGGALALRVVTVSVPDAAVADADVPADLPR